MEYKQFIQTIINNMKEYYGEGKKIDVREVKKNNGIILEGLTIFSKEETISPTIYLESFFKEFQDGKSMGDIMMDIINIYEKHHIKGCINMDFFMKYETVKGQIYLKVINYEKNQDKLRNMPHVKFLDLAAVCYFSYINDFIGGGAITIDLSHLDSWGISQEQLFDDAKRNTIEKLGLDLRGMDEILMEMVSERLDINDDEEMEEIMTKLDKDVPMYVMTLKGRLFGAACLQIKEYLKVFANKCRHNYYILPSSIHELILIPDTGSEHPEQLKNMVKEVNETQVAIEEQLSDNVYYYNFEEDLLSVI